MKIVEAKLFDYKSIIKTEIKIQEDLTCLVGVTGAGKTAVLELLHKIDNSSGFEQSDLPEKSETLSKFLSNDIAAEKIIQLEVKFDIEDFDKELLPDGFKNATSILLKRFFDGHWHIDVIQTEESSEKITINITEESKAFENIFSNISGIFDKHQARLPKIAEHRKIFDAAKETFVSAIQTSPAEINVLLETFKGSLFTIPIDAPVKAELDKCVIELQNVNKIILEKLAKDPLQQIYENVPKPELISTLPEVTDKISLDEFLNDVDANPTFKTIGIICGFNKSLLNNIRNSENTTKRNFFEEVSIKLSKEFKLFWTQTDYELIVDLETNDLTFSVKDNITDRTTKATQRSEGLQWVLSLFFKIKSIISSTGSSHILLFDSPATAIHDSGKDEIRRFLTEMAENNHLQIIYTTHERALIDSWRLDRIRFVKKEKDEGTIIHEVKSDGIDSTRIEISKHIGSPAKYSLFGAPIIIHFEGPSDYRFMAALNEFAIDSNRKFLDPDIFSIDDMGGIDNAKNIMKICKSLGLEFYLVVDGGSKSRALKTDLGSDFEKYFIPLTDVIDKDAVDVEDLIDPELYYELFKLTYSEIDVPELSEIMDDDKKTVTCYSKWLKENDHGSLNKVGISKFLMNIIKSPNAKDHVALERTLKNYEKLVKLINKKLPKKD